MDPKNPTSTTDPERYPLGHLQAVAADARCLGKKSERAVVAALLLADEEPEHGWRRRYELTIRELARITDYSEKTVKAVSKALPRRFVSTSRRDRFSSGTRVALATADQRRAVLARETTKLVADGLNDEFGTTGRYGLGPMSADSDGELVFHGRIAGLTEDEARRLLAVYAEVKASALARRKDDDDE